jgi:hypothetical protein
MVRVGARLTLLAALVAAVLAPAGAARSQALRLASPQLTAPPSFATSLAPVRDRVLRAAPRTLAEEQWWGGPITNNRGDRFNFFVSTQYGQDEGARARWANFLGWALHGKELEKLSLYQAPLASVQSLCGSEAVLGCYFPGEGKLVFPGDTKDPVFGSLNPSEILLHEYGHHLAMNRRNDPWPAVDWGAKNWASFENICRRADRRQVRPGDEGRFYLLNPGEAFAETYRLLNVRRAERSDSAWYQTWGPPLPWQWQEFSRTDDTLAAVEKDVLKPWTSPRVLRWAGRTPRKAQGYLRYSAERTAERRVFTPLDGTITIVLRSAPKGSYITLDRRFGGDLDARRSITTQVCGESSLLVQVTTVVPRGKFTVTVSRP